MKVEQAKQIVSKAIEELSQALEKSTDPASAETSPEPQEGYFAKITWKISGETAESKKGIISRILNSVLEKD